MRSVHDWNYAFQVVNWGLNQDFSVGLQLEETGPELFDFDPDSYLEAGEVPELAHADPIPDAPQALPLDPSTELSGRQEGTQVELIWRNPKSTLFDHAAIVADGVEGTTALVSGLGAIMSVMVDAAPGARSYLIRARAGDGVTTVDSAEITVTVT